jgi:hypothetical protein
MVQIVRRMVLLRLFEWISHHTQKVYLEEGEGGQQLAMINVLKTKSFFQ